MYVVSVVLHTIVSLARRSVITINVERYYSVMCISPQSRTHGSTVIITRELKCRANDPFVVGRTNINTRTTHLLTVIHLYVLKYSNLYMNVYVFGLINTA